LDKIPKNSFHKIGPRSRQQDDHHGGPSSSSGTTSGVGPPMPARPSHEEVDRPGDTCIRVVKAQRAILSLTAGPQGITSPLGDKMYPRGPAPGVEVCP
jgi:hypothetical protein